MNSIPKVTIRTIREFFGDHIVDKGFDYFNNGALFDTIQRGNALYSLCKSTHAVYRQYCSFAEGQIFEIHCTCPGLYDYGPCKHLAALLIAWNNNSAHFQVYPTLHEQLNSKSFEDIKTLISNMSNHDPETEDLIYSLLEGRRIYKEEEEQNGQDYTLSN